VPGPSFASLYAEQAGRVRRALVLSGATADVAEDVAQEAFARTYARWRRVRAGTNPAGYVFRVAFRELRRRGHLPDEPDGDAAATETPVDGHGPDEQALARVAADAARAAIGALPALAPPPELTGEGDREDHASPVSSEGVGVRLA
jgi:DNA-directed RNA polymerase specialized sigma24 family protein